MRKRPSCLHGTHDRHMERAADLYEAAELLVDRAALRKTTQAIWGQSNSWGCRHGFEYLTDAAEALGAANAHRENATDPLGLLPRHNRVAASVKEVLSQLLRECAGK